MAFLSIGLKEVAMSLARRGINLMQINRSILRGSHANIGDYVALTKPRVMSLVVFTALVGLLVAPGGIDPFAGVVALVCIAAGAGAAGALNMWYDADIDAVMARTAMRPIPSGRVSRSEALIFGLVLGLCAILALGTLLNMAAAALLAFTIFFYVVVYTMWLKRRTPQNIVIGGAAGGAPPPGWRRCAAVARRSREGGNKAPECSLQRSSGSDLTGTRGTGVRRGPLWRGGG